MSTKRSIRLRGTTPEVDVDVDHVYFPFASGRPTYDCATCGSQCCRGHDVLASRGPELDDQLGAMPALRFFVPSSGQTTGRTLLLRNYQPGCCFLSEGGLCGIQCGRGYAAKPAIAGSRSTASPWSGSTSRAMSRRDAERQPTDELRTQITIRAETPPGALTGRLLDTPFGHKFRRHR